MTNMNILGIDFGTTKTLAARWDERTQTARPIRLGRSGDAIPTTIYCDEKGEFQYGEDADDMRAIDSAGWKGRIKRDLGRGSSVILNGRRHQVVGLVARFLAYVLERVEEEVFHGKVDKAVITVPALYGPAERDELKAAAALAGLENVELLDEPVAAGRAFLHDKAGTELGNQVLVFDWGGGTLDLALVERQDGDFHLNHDWIGGEKCLGGEDIDDAMIEVVDGICAETHGRIDEQEDGRQMHIRRNLKEGKELLSKKTEHKLRLPYQQRRELVWSRDELEVIAAAITDRAIDCLRKHVEKIRSKGINPGEILLVGGSSGMPVVKRRIEAELGLKALLWENSQTAVALGAAIYRQQKPADKTNVPGKISSLSISKKRNSPALSDSPSLALQSSFCNVHVRPAEVGLIIGAAEPCEPLETEEQLSVFIQNHVMQCFLDLVIENKSPEFLRSPRLTLNNEDLATPHFVQMDDIPPHEIASYDSLKLNWVITAGDEIQVEFANKPGFRSVIKVTASDFAQTWAENDKTAKPAPVFVTWRRGWFKGAVLSITNISNQKISDVTLSTSAGDTATKHEIEAGGCLEIGNLELTGNRNFHGGDIFYINSSGFLPVAGFVIDEDGNCQNERGWVKVAKAAATIGLGAAGISLGG